MIERKPILVFFMIIAWFACDGETQQPQTDKVVALVNNRPILKSQLDKSTQIGINSFEIQNPDSSLTRKQRLRIRREVLEDLILQSLIRAEADHLGISVSSIEIDREIKIEQDQFPDKHVSNSYLIDRYMDYKTFRDIIEDRIYRRKVIQHLAGTKGKVTEEMMRKYYEKNLDRFSQPETRDMEHLTIFLMRDTAQEKASARKIMEKIVKELESGASMRKLEQKYSESGSRIVVNSLSGIMKGTYSEVDEVLFNLQEGQLSDIIENETGLHVIRCLKINPPHLRSYESSMFEIRERLHYIIFGFDEKKIMDKLKNEADIKIFDY